VSVNRTELLAEVDRAIAERSLLKHPFYQDWQAGTLRRGRLQLYAAQYYVHVEAFPAYLKVLAGRASGRLRDFILENLADEEDPAAPHPRLWRDFAGAVGVHGETLWMVAPLSGIRRLLETYRKICARGSFVEAVAALYAYESQVPEISSTKREGLRRYYGVTTDKGLAYFKVHEEADRVHRAAWRSWLLDFEKDLAGEGVDAIEERILGSVRRSLDALWGALDSVQEANLE
jgi:pyrroloquinoline-quinone synthase